MLYPIEGKRWLIEDSGNPSGGRVTSDTNKHLRTSESSEGIRYFEFDFDNLGYPVRPGCSKEYGRRRRGPVRMRIINKRDGENVFEIKNCKNSSCDRFGPWNWTCDCTHAWQDGCNSCGAGH